MLASKDVLVKIRELELDGLRPYEIREELESLIPSDHPNREFLLGLVPCDERSHLEREVFEARETEELARKVYDADCRQYDYGSCQDIANELRKGFSYRQADHYPGEELE